MSMMLKGTFVGVSQQLNTGVVTNAKLGTDITIGGSVTILPYCYNTITQGTWAWNNTASQVTGGDWWNSTEATGDQIDYSVYLSAGTYTIITIAETNTRSGIMKFKIDDTDLGVTVDEYSGGLVANVRFATAGIVIATNGIKKFSVYTNSKNGASGAYRLLNSAYYFLRTA